VSRLTATGNTGGSEHVLVEDWCQAYYSHAMQEVRFGPDGMLYVGGGDGARVNPPDHGQYNNPCNDPVDEGGSLRAQDLRTAGDPVSLDGSIIRIDPTTGAGAPGNPLAASPDANARRIVAEGLRNPFRFSFRPGTEELWIGDVGWRTHEEINRLVDPTDGSVDNFGWPCYEGEGRQAGWDELDLPVCENLYTSSGQTEPYFRYAHSAHTVPNDDCAPGNQGSVSSPTFYPGGSYPDRYDHGLFFGDYARQCLFFMPVGANGLPNPAARELFSSEVGGLVDLEIGPGDDLFYVDILSGSIHRIRFDASGNQPPVAVAHADPTAGPAPLAVQFHGDMSTDPDGDALTYVWDLDGDGAFDDSTAANPTRTYTTVAAITVRLRVTDSHGATNVASVVINVGGGPGSPVPTITAPTATSTWQVGQTITYSGRATDPEDGTLPASRLSWSITLFHCPDGQSCHAHPQASTTGASGTFPAPDHEYYAYLRFTLTATDSDGKVASISRDIQPQTRTIRLQSQPSGVTLGLNDEALPAPFTRTVIRGSTNTISAPATASIGGVRYRFDHWSDGSTVLAHDVVPDANMTRTATYEPDPTAPPGGYWIVEADGTVTAFGGVPHLGNAGPFSMDVESTPTGAGYWVVDARGAVYAFGDAPALSAGLPALLPGETATSISRTATGQGYWIFTSRGRALRFGDAQSFGDLGTVALNGPVLDSVSTPSGHGYFMVASDGGVFAFGDAVFAGSMGSIRLNAPVQSLVPDGDGVGYWLVASDGGVFAFDAPFRGSTGSIRLNRPISGMVRYGNGYLIVAEDGGVFDFSDLPFSGSLGSTPPNSPVVSVAASG
jgi:glucose/arabinose dehydrogenase